MAATNSPPRSEKPPVRLSAARRRAAWLLAALALFLAVGYLVFRPFRGADTLLNVSYDGSRTFFSEVNEAFASREGASKVRMSHAASGMQSESILRGAMADVATLGTPADIDRLSAESGLIGKDWRSKFPNDASPYSSTIVFAVRPGNPFGVRDWKDLVEKNLTVLAPSPKASAAGKWAYLAAWGNALNRNGGDELAAERFVAALYAKPPVLDAGARAVLEEFVAKGRGDVLLTWENEAWDAVERHGRDKIEIVYPPRSVRATPSVAVVDRNVEKRGTRNAAKAYAGFLFTPEAQKIAAGAHLRPYLEEAADSQGTALPPIDLFGVEDTLGPWPEVQKRHFDDGGIFDRIRRFEEMKRAAP